MFPHVPFPARRAVFDQAARLGREIRAVETFARAPGAAYRRASFCRLVDQPAGPLAPVRYEDGALTLCADGSGRMTGVPLAVWSFAVSGYRVLPRWLEAREGLLLNVNLVREIRDVAGRITELLDLFGRADSVLVDTLADPLTRAALAVGASEEA